MRLDDLTSLYINVVKGGTIPEWVSELTSMQTSYGLCMDWENRYTYDCSTVGNTQSVFYRYLYISELEPDVYQINSKVIWYKRGYHEYEIQTIVTDWRRI